VSSDEETAALRAEFVRLLTVDSDTGDRRRKGFNQAIFATEQAGGYAVWVPTDGYLDMILAKFDKAVKNLRSP